MSHLLCLNTIPNPYDDPNIFTSYSSSVGKTYFKELRHIAASEKCFIKESKSIIEDITYENLSNDEQFVSFDIKDMYPSLPKYDVLSEINNRINDTKFVTSMDKFASIELAILSLRCMSFTTDQNYFNEKQGLFIGTSTFIIKIYIQRVGKNHVYTMLNVQVQKKIASHDFGATLQKLNFIDENIEFSKQKASGRNLPFPDSIISVNEKREIMAKVYSKRNHKRQYTHFSANQPQHVKLSTIKTLVRRARFI